MSAGDGIGWGDGCASREVFDEMRTAFSAAVPDDGQYWNQFEAPVPANGILPQSVFQLVRYGLGAAGPFNPSHHYGIRFFSGEAQPLVQAEFECDGKLHVENRFAAKVDILKAAIKAVARKDYDIVVDPREISEPAPRPGRRI